MKKRARPLKIYTHAEVEDELIGKPGTPRRDEYEMNISLGILGRAIRERRIKRKLKQEQLGALVGLKKSYVAKIEQNARYGSTKAVLRIMRVLKFEGLPQNTSQQKAA